MQAGEEQGRQAVEEAVTHGSVVEGPRCSEGRERNAMGEERQDKGSQRRGSWAEGRRGSHHPTQEYIELLLESRSYWGKRTRDSNAPFSHLKPPALQTQGNTMQTKTAEIRV